MTLSRITTANYLIIRIFIGGVSIASNDSDAVAQEIKLLPYVAKRQFITQNSKISTCKDSDFFANSQKVAAECDFRLTIFNFRKRCSIHSTSSIISSVDGCKGSQTSFRIRKGQAVNRLELFTLQRRKKQFQNLFLFIGLA